MSDQRQPPSKRSTRPPEQPPVSGSALTIQPSAAPPVVVGGQKAMSVGAKAFLDKVEGQRQIPVQIPLVKINHGEGSFQLPTGELVESISGYPVYYFHTRKFYKSAYQPGKSGPPDCWSSDLVEPHMSSVQKQAESCAQCPMNVFGTGRDGRSMACNVQTWVFLLNPEFGNPPLWVLVVPVSSLKILVGNRFSQGYFAQAIAKHEVYEIVWSKFGLTRTAEGAPHCLLVPTMGPAANDPEQCQMIASIRNEFLTRMDGLRMKTPDLGRDEA